MSHEHIEVTVSKIKLLICLWYLNLCLDSLNSLRALSFTLLLKLETYSQILKIF